MDGFMHSLSHSERREMRMTEKHYKSNFWLLFVLAAATIVSGCAQSDVVVPPPAAQPLSMALMLCDTGTQGCAGSGTFSISTIRDLSLGVEWQNVPGGTHTQEIALVQPNGVIYQSVSHGFSIPDGTTGTSSVSDVIPVAGTFITQRSLTGQWSIQVSLDGKPVASQTFQFEP